MRGSTATALCLELLAAGTTVAKADEWTGVYIWIGGGMGAAVHELSVENDPAIPQFPFAASLDGLGGDGGFFSLGAGVDYQINGKWVIGAFFDYDWMSLDTEVLDLSVSQPISFSAGADIEVEDMWSVGGRIGHLVTPSTLLFLTAGYARADISDLNFRGSGGISGTLVRVGDFDGYFIGGGAELKITQAISLKAEYRYTDLGDEKVTLLPGLTSPDPNDFVTTKLDPSIQTARLALNYRFGLGRGEVGPDPVEEAPVG
jgi:outer membrane immunogenic protein